mgnify:CR=1 FL=1
MCGSLPVGVTGVRKLGAGGLVLRSHSPFPAPVTCFPARSNPFTACGPRGARSELQRRAVRYCRTRGRHEAVRAQPQPHTLHGKQEEQHAQAGQAERCRLLGRGSRAGVCALSVLGMLTLDELVAGPGTWRLVRFLEDPAGRMPARRVPCRVDAVSVFADMNYGVSE